MVEPDAHLRVGIVCGVRLDGCDRAHQLRSLGNFGAGRHFYGLGGFDFHAVAGLGRFGIELAYQFAIYLLHFNWRGSVC